ncbi:MAG TPA: RNA pyrophosphohydrolase [Henriciella marina]|uniref:RNA pyrophosphohydrolase n=1 Tax=Henriciella sp. TaxID=1968823 RepID=UPI0017EAD3A6|nr:RNA pyrophosphohydrolase [Henriciella sp.]HIG21359.1 RNA pyrophosphohydrolase [Henriciella sp.]HIK64474.1 RNA pyrophosphohydrolase [Henriciella marina]
MTIQTPDPSLYRPNVGLVLFSATGYIFLGRRINGRGAFQWQMPQGGIDEGETAHDAALRELEEEIGVSDKLVDVLEETSDWLFYEFPAEVRRRMPGAFIGQRQKWFALRFKGSDSDIRLDRHTPEFDAWRWARLSEAPAAIVPFKRPVYQAVAERFRPWAGENFALETKVGETP